MVETEFEIRPSSGWRLLDVRELWAYRELLYFLAWRDVKVRYKQTAIGLAWVLLQPLALMLVFTLFFGRFLRIPSDGIPYPLFALAGLLPWQLFSRALTDSTNSLVTDQRLISRVYFPRILAPAATAVAALVDFVIGFAFLVLLLFVFGMPVGVQVLWLPAFVLLLMITALGVGFWLSAFNVEYRDVAYTIPFLNQFWFFVTPVIYPVTNVPDQWRMLLALNPMAGVVEGFRWCLFGAGNGPDRTLMISVLVSFALFLSGIVWFRRRERTFADAIGSGGR